MVIPPAEIFKCCLLESFDLQTKTVTLVGESWPVVLMGDGCKVNVAASQAMTNTYGLMSPSARTCRRWEYQTYVQVIQWRK